ncbi:hypothetical protein BT69DRAFT_880569 [Atractiella rhizophila]|nr:hypothetical protein BT69DRAFT_880569 [Atractiella rhizophila]
MTTPSPLSSLLPPPHPPLQIPLSSPSSPHSAPKSLHPRILLLISREQVPSEIRDGLDGVVGRCVRGNLKWIEDYGEQRGWDETWRIRFHNDCAQPQLEISTTHQDFSQVPADEQFFIDIHYGRKIEAFRALGHVFGATRALVDIKDVDVSRGERRWKTDVQNLLNRQEVCQFETHG